MVVGVTLKGGFEEMSQVYHIMFYYLDASISGPTVKILKHKSPVIETYVDIRTKSPVMKAYKSGNRACFDIRTKSRVIKACFDIWTKTPDIKA